MRGSFAVPSSHGPPEGAHAARDPGGGRGSVHRRRSWSGSGPTFRPSAASAPSTPPSTRCVSGWQPSLGRGAASSVIVRDGGAYRLALDRGDHWDGRHLPVPRAPGRRSPRSRTGSTGCWPQAAHAAFLPGVALRGLGGGPARGGRTNPSRGPRGARRGAGPANQPRSSEPVPAPPGDRPRVRAWHRALMQTFLQAGSAPGAAPVHACRRSSRTRSAWSERRDASAVRRDALRGVRPAAFAALDDQDRIRSENSSCRERRAEPPLRASRRTALASRRSLHADLVAEDLRHAWY